MQIGSDAISHGSARMPYNPVVRRHMVEDQMLLTRGFGNVFDASKAKTGFRLKCRAPYFRGIWMTVISDIGITVDGERFDRSKLLLDYKHRRLTLADASRADDLHWDFGDTLDLFVEHPGGIAPGIHMVSLRVVLLPSLTPIVADSERLMTLVR